MDAGRARTISSVAIRPAPTPLRRFLRLRFMGVPPLGGWPNLFPPKSPVKWSADQLEQIPLRFVAAAHPAQVIVCLAGADDRPLDVAEGLPVAHSIAIDGRAAGHLVGSDELI